VSHCQHNGSLRPYSRISRQEPLLFLTSNSSVVLTRLSAPRSRSTISRKIWQSKDSNPGPRTNCTDRPTDRPNECSLSVKLVPTFDDGGYRAVSAKDPHGQILGIVDRHFKNIKLKNITTIISSCTLHECNLCKGEW
jgi:hypothetical protein